MPTENDSERTNETRRILDRVSKEADSNGFAQLRPVSADRGAPTGTAEELDPIDALATRIGRTLGLVITVGIVVWLILYVIGKA